jgi:hypothetical protein
LTSPRSLGLVKIAHFQQSCAGRREIKVGSGRQKSFTRGSAQHEMSQWWNLALPEAILGKVEAPPHSVAQSGVATGAFIGGCARPGLPTSSVFPSMVTLDRPGGPIWRNREDHILSLLSPDELAVWHVERDRAGAEGLLFMAHPLHCAVGAKPLPA